jgi:unsaturated rhamnogalacturonyl hydrolase
MRKVMAIVAVLVLAGMAGAAEIPQFKDWPAGKSPAEIGKKVALDLLRRPAPARPSTHYAEDSCWYASLQFAKLTHDAELTKRLIDRFEPFLGPTGQQRISNRAHVDDRIFGIVPLEIYIQNKDEKYLTIGKDLADKQWQNPRPDGLTAETRFWIDDMYMITILQLQAYRATGDKTYLDRAALEMVAYLDRLQQPNGLFYHGERFPFFWGRGNGWVAGGMAELLSELPADHPRRARVMEGYTKMMAALLKFQDSDGMFHQLIDGPDSYKETSCTAMFTFAFVMGAKNGWLQDPAYAEGARKGWIGLQAYIDEQGLVDKVCVGTGQQNNRQFYLDRPTQKGDFHGQAPVQWCAVALLR